MTTSSRVGTSQGTAGAARASLLVSVLTPSIYGTRLVRLANMGQVVPRARVPVAPEHRDPSPARAAASHAGLLTLTRLRPAMNPDLVAGGVDRAEFAVLVVKTAGNRPPGVFEVGLSAVEIVGPKEELRGPGWMPRLLLVEADGHVRGAEASDVTVLGPDGIASEERAVELTSKSQLRLLDVHRHIVEFEGSHSREDRALAP